MSPAAKKLRGFEGFFYFQLAAVAATAATTTSDADITVDDASGITVGAAATGTGIPTSTTVLSVAGTTVTLSHAATATATGVAVTFTPAKVKLAHCSGWDIDVKRDQIDATDHDTIGWKDNLDGLGDFTGTIDSIYFTNDATQTSLLDAVLSGGVVIAGDFRPLDKVGELNYTGNLVITDYKAAAKLSTAQARNISFAGRGALTRGTIAA